MITLSDWQLNNQQWLDKDLALLSTLAGWKEAAIKEGITIWQQPFADDKNNLFKWAIPSLNATHNQVFDVFVNKMTDYHHYWTKEYTGGFVVEQISDNAQIVYQQFNPGIPGITSRDLLYLQWSRKIDDRTMQTSFRSVVFDGVPLQKGFERIDWWGAHLFTANPDGTSQLALIDRENQGGFFPVFMMNKMMPGYLVYQYKKIIEFFKTGGVETHNKLPELNNTALKIKQAYTAPGRQTLAS
jgi:hypothetical protein